MDRQVEAAQAAYVDAVEQLMARYEWVESKVHRRKMAREAARSVLPNATEVKIVASANVRAWRTMLELRLGEGAELEIRRMAVACLRLLQQEAPALFADFEIYRSGGRERGGPSRVPQSVSDGQKTIVRLSTFSYFSSIEGPNSSRLVSRRRPFL